MINPEDKKWEGIYGVYFKKNDHNTFIGFYSETMSGICTPSGYTLDCKPLCKEIGSLRVSRRHVGDSEARVYAKKKCKIVIQKYRPMPKKPVKNGNFEGTKKNLITKVSFY